MPDGRPPEGHVEGSGGYPIHSGPALPPQRTATSVPPEEFLVNGPNSEGLPEGMPHGEHGAPQVASTPPPVAPAVSENAELRASVEEMKSAIGNMRKEHERQMAEAAFQSELATSAGRVSQAGAGMPPLPQLNAEAADQDVKAGDLYNVLNQILPRVYAGAAASGIRATWDVSATEEQQALQKYPVLANYPEPDRSHHVLRAVRMQRQLEAPVNPAPTPPSAVPATPTSTSRPAQPAVAAPEATIQAIAPEPVQSNPLEAAGLAYQRAEAMPARNQSERSTRMSAMRAANRQIEELQGLGDPEIAKRRGFSQKG